jgi:hypothetical protein
MVFECDGLVVGWVQPAIGSGLTAGGLHPPDNLRTVESVTLAPFLLKHADFWLHSRSLSRRRPDSGFVSRIAKGGLFGIIHHDQPSETK